MNVSHYIDNINPMSNALTLELYGFINFVSEEYKHKSYKDTPINNNINISTERRIN